MKDKLIGIALGAGLVGGLMFAYGFKGDGQAESAGRFRVFSAAEDTYLVDTSTGATWREMESQWMPVKRPNMAFGPITE